MIRNVRSSNRRKSRKALRSRVWLNDEEVTRICFYADDRVGIVRCYKQNDKKWAFVDPRTGLAATEELRGRVRIKRREL